VQGDDFAAGVDRDDAPALDAFDALAEEPGLRESVAGEVEVAGEGEFPGCGVGSVEVGVCCVALCGGVLVSSEQRRRGERECVLLFSKIKR
jgi:hypothetical protein